MGGSRHLIGAATCLSALIPDAVGGRSGENYKVISLRFTRQLTGRNVARDIINLPHDERMMISGSKSKGETSLV